jgi:hypothetical protein
MLVEGHLGGTELELEIQTWSSTVKNNHTRPIAPVH